MSTDGFLIKEEYYVCLRTMFSTNFSETFKLPKKQVVFSKNNKYKAYTTIVHTEIDYYSITQIYSPHVDKKVTILNKKITENFININSYRKEKINNIF